MQCFPFIKGPGDTDGSICRRGRGRRGRRRNQRGGGSRKKRRCVCLSSTKFYGCFSRLFLFYGIPFAVLDGAPLQRITARDDQSAAGYPCIMFV